MSILHLDYETRSNLDLRQVGLHSYARGRNTDLMCACFAFDEEQVFLWLPGMPVPQRLIDHVEEGGEVHAHNAAFEQELCNNVATRKYGWPYLYTEQLVCTMAMSYAMGLPGHLGSTAAALGIDQQKDMVGNRLMLQYCQPRDVTPEGKIIWWDDPDQLKAIWEYCRQDVIVEREIGRRMMRLSPYERKVWELDQKINSRGIAVDTKAVLQATVIVEQEKLRLIKEIQHASDNAIATPQAVAQIKNYLSAKLGLESVDSLAKQDVVDLLGQIDLPEDCRRILELRQEASKTSTAKLERMLSGAGVSASDATPRIRGSFQYSGANTRRWAGRGIQLQNLPRPKINGAIAEQVLNGLHRGDVTRDQIDLLYGRPLDIISDCIRGFLVAAPGHDLLACDFSSIEARVIAWLAGEENALEIFRTHGRIYEDAASHIFGKTLDRINDSERQVGKVAVLALGYGGGVGAFRQMAKGYGVQLEPAFEALWSRADVDVRNKALFNYQQNHKRYAPITQKEFLACDLTKIFWRAANPNIVSLWRQLEAAAVAAVLSPGQKVSAGKISFRTKGSFLWCQLPSSGVLCFPYPKIDKIELPWGGERDGLTYMSEDGQSKKWLRFKTYGGSLSENVTQAVARDLLADAMLRLEVRGYPIVAHVHDEIVCELKEGAGAISEMSDIMCERPEWAKDLPIRAAGFRGKRYRK